MASSPMRIIRKKFVLLSKKNTLRGQGDAADNGLRENWALQPLLLCLFWVLIHFYIWVGFGECPRLMGNSILSKAMKLMEI